MEIKELVNICKKIQMVRSNNNDVLNLISDKEKLIITYGTNEFSLQLNTASIGEFEVTVSAEQFIKLMASLKDEAEFEETPPALIVKTKTGRFTLPQIKEKGYPVKVPVIKGDGVRSRYNIDPLQYTTIATKNVLGYMGAIITKDIQNFIYLDNQGAITFTESIYLNEFETIGDPFKLLLNINIASFLKLLDVYKEATMEISNNHIITITTRDFKFAFRNQNESLIERFPYLKMRDFIGAEEISFIEINKKVIENAIKRLAIFDKKDDLQSLENSMVIFTQQGMKLESQKTKNYEIIPYLSTDNLIEKEFCIRFIDLARHIKSIDTPSIRVGYGIRPCLLLYTDLIQVIPCVITR